MPPNDDPARHTTQSASGEGDSVDFGILAANFGQSGKVWDQGDFAYTGTVNSVDFGLLAANFGDSASGTAVVVTQANWAALDAFAAANGLMADVPEPTLLGFSMFAGVGSKNSPSTIFSLPL